MKKLWVVVALVTLVGVIAPLRAAQAFSIPETTSFTAKIVDAFGTPQSVFGWNETPYLFVNYSESIWGAVGFNVLTKPDSSNILNVDGFWGSNKLAAIPNWNSIKQIGDWDVSSLYLSLHQPASIKFGQAKNSFTVTPEPVSAALFILGGSLLAFRRRRSA